MATLIPTGSDPTMLAAQAKELGADDNNKDINQHKKDVDTAGQLRQANDEEATRLLQQAEALQKQLDDLQKQAKDTGFFDKFTGRISSLEKQIAQAQHDATVNSENSQQSQTFAKAAEQEEQDQLQTMQDALNQLQTLVQDYSKNLASTDQSEVPQGQ